MMRALLVVLVLARTAQAGSIHLRDDLVLGIDDATEITADGAAAIVASVGAVDAPVGGNARFHLPPQHFPQRAIVAALDAKGAVIDWIVVPLAGRANVKVQTDPGASVVVRIAGKELAPVSADRSGIATIPVVVPPGVVSAIAIATSGGKQTEKRLALEAPAFPRVLVACGTEARVTVVAIESDGTPASAPPVVTAGGEPLAVTTRAPGLFEAKVTSAAPQVAIAAAFGDGPPATCTLALAVVEPLPAPRPQIHVVVAPPPAGPPRFATALRGGVISNLGPLASPLVAVDGELRLGALVFGAELVATRGTFATSAADGERISTTVAAVPVLARVAYRRELGSYALDAGVGAGVAFASASVSSASVGQMTTTATVLAGSLFATASRGPFVLEAGYLHASLSTGPARGSIGGLCLSAGYALRF